MQVETFDFNTTHLVGASGKKYIVRHSINAEEYKILEELRIEIECGNSVGDLVRLQSKAVQALQKNDVYGASIALYNATNIAERIQEAREPAWLLSLTLFVKPEGFTGKWSEQEASQWIADWGNYKSEDLFSLAITCRIAFDSAFTRASQAILEQANASAGDNDQSGPEAAGSR